MAEVIQQRGRCPECDAPLSTEALHGLCSRCLVRRTFTHRSRRMETPLPDLRDVEASFTEFQVRELVGRGGMGAVYAGWQRSLDRLVALKILSPSLLGSEDFAERFQREARIMAQLDHPNIAKVFDAGVTEGGEPYIVMELIRGYPITQFAEQRCPSLDQRLELFRGACRGVLHAHLRGIVHRDIKPSNVLVQEHDGVSIPKVIDFGLAKSHSSPTGLGRDWESAYRLGTPGYVSPEQMSGTEIVDMRSDIFSLGALFRELLGGLDTRKELSAVAAKACAERPDDRYQTVAALLEDLDRFEKHELVTALPASGVYRLRKFVRRRRWLVASSGALLLLLLTGAWLIVRETLLTREAERLAAERLRQGEALIDYMLRDLYAKLDTVGRLDILQGTLNQVEGFYASAESDPQRATSLAHRAQARRLSGMVRSTRGEIELGRTNYLEAIELFDQALALEGLRAEWLDGLAQAWNSLAVSHHSRLEVREAEGAYENALAANGQALKLSPGNIDWIDSRASTLHNRGALLEAAGRLTEAQEHYEEALELWDSLLTREPGNPGILDHLAYVHQNLAFLYARKGETNLAAKANGEALRIREDLSRRDTNNTQWLSLLADIRHNISDFHFRRNELDLAESFLNQSLPIREQLAERDGSNAGWQEALVKAYQHQAAVLSKRGRTEAAALAERRAKEVAGRREP